MSQTITVKCPQCERIYIDWHVPSVSEQTGQQTNDSYQPSTVCSKCGHRSTLNKLTEQDGVFQQI